MKLNKLHIKYPNPTVSHKQPFRSYCTTQPDMIETYLLVKDAMNRPSNASWALRDFPSLNSSLCKLQGITSCFGELQVNKNNRYAIRVNGKDAGTFWMPNLSVLLQEAKDAPFGKGEIAYDEKVRKGLQITESELQIENLLYLVPKEIQNLAPLNYSIIPKLYKMHIYTPGGHFDLHRDTPHAANHLATLIITLPSPFEGGGLTLVDYKEQRTFPLTSENEAAKNGHWIAFYTDIKHKVERVISGTRVALQFDLLAVSNEGQDRNPKENQVASWASQQRTSGKDCNSLTELSTELKKELEQNPNQQFALVLKHRYTSKGLKPELLKNVDQTLWKHLEACFDISLTPVITQV